MTYANSFQFRSCIPEVDTSDSQMLTVKPAMIVIRQLHVDCIKIGVLFFTLVFLLNIHLELQRSHKFIPILLLIGNVLEILKDVLWNAAWSLVKACYVPHFPNEEESFCFSFGASWYCCFLRLGTWTMVAFQSPNPGSCSHLASVERNLGIVNEW